MRYARTYGDFQLGVTSSTPSGDPHAWRSDPADRGFSWTGTNARREDPHGRTTISGHQHPADRS